MNAKLHRNEHGITTLETAIILIAFVVVAAIFAFTVLSTGTFLTEKSKEAAYAGLQEVRGSMELKGSVVITGTAVNSNHKTIIFNLAPVSGGSSVDLTKIKITYRDQNSNVELAYDGTITNTIPTNNKWSATDVSSAPAAMTILPTGSMAKITVGLSNAIVSNQTFALEVKPQTGGILLIERTAPAQLDSITDLH